MFAAQVCFQAVPKFCGLPVISISWRKLYHSETVVPQINTVRIPPCVSTVIALIEIDCQIFLSSDWRQTQKADKYVLNCQL